MPTLTNELLDEARRQVRGQGARVTYPRVRVFAELLRAHEALSHLDLQRRIENESHAEPIDRVTLYRVLEWLVEAGLAHRVSGPDRVYRFSAQPAGHAMHGHFRCAACQRMFCLEEAAGLARVVKAMLPEGFTSESVELTVSGRCGECASALSVQAPLQAPVETPEAAAHRQPDPHPHP
ncbi:MAG TPA: Fur family transcriptional regulator [Burkholderiaceae bacterium]|jgi:Fur family ferric uptake transcriptional regulator|nr:Fur family transcriptional regulator [Burkholderiaceae bacterium]